MKKVMGFTLLLLLGIGIISFSFSESAFSPLAITNLNLPCFDDERMVQRNMLECSHADHENPNVIDQQAGAEQFPADALTTPQLARVLVATQKEKSVIYFLALPSMITKVSTAEHWSWQATTAYRMTH